MSVLALDIGGTNLRIGLVDTALDVYALKVIPSRSIYETSDTAGRLVDIINEYIEENRVSDEVSIIAAGFPSLVDKSRRILLSSTNFPGLDGVDIVSVLENGTGKPVIIDHDAYYILANDINRSDIRAEDAILGFYFGTGLGCAMYINGRPYYGKHGSACEIGHMPVPFGEYRCSCGTKGCIEMYSCGKRLEQIVSESFPDCPISEIFIRHGSDSVIDDLIRYIAVPIATEINMLDPDTVFIGGGVVYTMGFPQDRLLEYIMANVRHPYPFEDTRIIFSQDSPLNGLVGAAIAGFNKLGQALK